MEKSLSVALPFICVYFLKIVEGFPIDIPSLGAGQPHSLWITGYYLTAVCFLLVVIAGVFGCVCCRNGKGFKEFSNSSGSLAISRQDPGFVNPVSNSELTIFPPAGVNSNQTCRFEPLPDIKPQAPNLRPAAFSYAEREISSQDWFCEPHNNFPRNKLKYLQEYGRGWFGRVVEGEAQNITPKEKVTKVMVKILHEDATPTDQMYFLHEVKFYRDLKHPNILSLLGRCLETEPFLVILECYPNGDLKTFLSQNLASARAMAEQGVTLQMCSNITSGLQFMHENKFIHTDLAARNCLVGPDLRVKIGDYGNSIEIFKSDYYCAGSVALPVRWCAPETLKCTDVTIETREVTPPANIWSLAIVFWEICEFCKLPYSELTDDQVIVRVLGEKNYFLEKPNMFCLYKDELYHLMKLCWNPPSQRPTAPQISLILENLISSDKTISKEVQTDSKKLSQDFDSRWQNLKPNYIPKRDNAVDDEYNANCNIISSKLKSAKVVDSSFIDSPLGIFMSDKSSGQESPRFCLVSEKEKRSEIEEILEEPELEKNSLEVGEISNKGTVIQVENIKSNDKITKKPQEKVNFELSDGTKYLEVSNPDQKFKNTTDVDSWLKGVEINNEEDESFVRKISEAIRDLDETLAMEKTSSSEETSGKSSHQNSPGKDLKENVETVVDFKLGSDTSSFLNFTKKPNFELTSLQNSEQPQSLNFTDPFLTEKKGEFDENFDPNSLIMPMIEESNNKFNIDESLKENDSLVNTQSRNSSDTDDEVWRKRIEKGEISEKVKEKSKSIANLMILTHIDPSDDSDIDIDKPFEKGYSRSSFLRSVSFARSSLSSNNFGSENDITNAVLEDDFKESLKKLSNDHKEYGRFDSLGMILPSSVRRENVWENFFKSDPFENLPGETKPTDVHVTSEEKNCSEEEKVKPNAENSNNFLGNVASEKLKDNKHLKDINKNEINENNPNKNNSSDSFSESDDNLINSSCLGKDSSHTRQNSVEANNVIVNSKSENFIAESKEKINELEKEYSCIGIENAFINESDASNKTNQSNKGEKISGELIDKNVNSETTKISENKNFIKTEGLHSKRVVDVNDLSIPMITMTEAEENEEKSPEEVFEPFFPKVRPFKFVLKEKDFIPQITITEEHDEENFVSNEETFEFSPQAFSKPFKFILKDFEEDFSEKLGKNEEFLIRSETSLEKPSFPPIECMYVENCNKIPINQDTITSNSNVIIGACEDFTLDYFKGLKTTSEDIQMDVKIAAENEKNLQNVVASLENKEDLDVWDKHLEKAFIQQLNNSDFNDISFKSLCLEFPESEKLDPKSELENGEIVFDPVLCPIQTITNFLETERIHTDKVEDPIHVNGMTSLSGIGSEEEYDNFKLRTPDDERSSDSGFRDKGSLSESVEDACEGKYNLEDIEAELEEAYVKGAFGNYEGEKEKDQKGSTKNSNFEFEETQFYEDENKNYEDLSDIDGEIEFWQNKDNADYYPEISEFNPICSQGWYLHPPDESTLNRNRNVNEDIVNALRNELQENLPVQTRSYEDFTNFYEPVIDDSKRELNIHYISDLGMPLSPIVEEQSGFANENKKSTNPLFESNHSNKVRRNMVNLMESVKSIDTNTFRQYLDYMIESEGKGLDELEEIEEKLNESKEDESDLPELVLENKNCGAEVNQNFEEDIKKALGLNTMSRSESSMSEIEPSNDALLLEDLEELSSDKVVPEAKTEEDILVVNINTNEATILESPKPKPYMAFVNSPERKDDYLEVISDNSENDGLIFTPEMLSPDRERSLSEISRSSNETRTGDALSDITLSSPDLVPDCFSTSIQEIVQNNEASEIIKDLEDSGIINEGDGSVSLKGVNEENVCSLPDITMKPQVQNELFLLNERQYAYDTSEESFDIPKNSEPIEAQSSEEANAVPDDTYEMSTSFMGADDDEGEEENSPCGEDFEEKRRKKEIKEGGMEDSYTADWESESSGGEEEMSSSSGEFIWKNGEVESNVKAVAVTDCNVENSMQKKLQSNENQSVASENNKAAPKIFDGGSNGNQNDDNGGIANEKYGASGDDDNDDDDNESSTGSSASITDFVPSAWNSQATPSRSALKSPEKKSDQKLKKNVWFKKQKYHCVYEYPREPSDNEETDNNPYSQIKFEKSSSDSPNKHFTFGVNTLELPNKHFPYGISNVIDYSSFTDWDVMEPDEGDLSLTDTDSDNGLGTSGSTNNKSNFNFYNLSPFDYDFGSAGIMNDDSEFFVSSSSRPFQGGSTSQFFPGNNQTTLFSDNSDFEKPLSKDIENTVIDSKDFVTPDSGLDDSTTATPLDKNIDVGQQSIVLQVDTPNDSKADILNLLDNLKFNFAPEIVEANVKNIDLEAFGNNKNTSSNGLVTSSSNNSPSPLSPTGLGELRHTRDKLKLDLPHNHNAELGVVVNKKNQHNSLKL